MGSVIQYVGAALIVLAINLTNAISEASQIGILIAGNGILLAGVVCVGRSAHSLGWELSQLGRLTHRVEDPPVTFPDQSAVAPLTELPAEG